MSRIPPFIFALLLNSAAVVCGAQSVAIGAGVPLRVTLDQRLKIGAADVPVSGHLADAVYVGDRLVVPAGSEVRGRVAEVNAAPRKQHLGMIMRGDFTPPRDPQIEFEKLILPNGQEIAIQTAVAQRSGEPVRMQEAKQRQSMPRRLKSMAKERKAEALRTLKEDRKWSYIKDRLLLSLPYHPQWIDAGTPFDAALSAPVEVPVREQSSADLSQVGMRLPSNSILHARLLSPISSGKDKQGNAVSAVLTDPLFDEQHRLLLPEGTLLKGAVTRAKPARRFARNGQLRFTFTSIDLPGEMKRPLLMHGQLTATEGDPAANLTVDAEGGTQAQSPKNKYLAPLTVAFLASTAQVDDEGGSTQGFFAGGFGLLGRAAVLGARLTPVSSGFAYYALSQSVYSRLIARGHDVTFPKNTRMEIQIGER